MWSSRHIQAWWTAGHITIVSHDLQLQVMWPATHATKRMLVSHMTTSHESVTMPHPGRASALGIFSHGGSHTLHMNHLHRRMNCTWRMIQNVIRYWTKLGLDWNRNGMGSEWGQNSINILILPRVWPVSLMVSNADHVRDSCSNWLNQVKEVFPLQESRETMAFLFPD